MGQQKDLSKYGRAPKVGNKAKSRRSAHNRARRKYELQRLRTERNKAAAKARFDRMVKESRARKNRELRDKEG